MDTVGMKIVCWIFTVIGVVVVVKACQIFYKLAKESAYFYGVIVPLKYGVMIFAIIFLLIKIFGYRLDIGIAAIYFALMLAGIAGVIHGYILLRRPSAKENVIKI
jgi:hypothetical protein